MEEVPQEVSGDGVLLIRVDLHILVDAEVVVEHLRRRHQYPSERLVKVAGGDLLLEHVGAVLHHLVLCHLLRVPKANVARDGHRDQLVLLVIELEQLDLVGVGLDALVVLLCRLVDEVDHARDAAEDEKVESLGVVSSTDRAAVLELLLV